MFQAILCCKKRQKQIEFLKEPQMEFYPAEWNPLEPSDLDETWHKNGETQGIEQTRDEEQPSAAGQLNHSAERRGEPGQNREESPQLSMEHSPNQANEEASENPIVLRPVEQSDPQEESKEA